MKGWEYVVALAFGFLIIGLAVMLSWNMVICALFYVPRISFMQAIGLFILTNLLFGGVSGGKTGNS